MFSMKRFCPGLARIALLFTIAVIASGCSAVQEPRSDLTNEAESVSEKGYALQPGDVIRISVWREPELDQVVLVRPDGGISFPLAGEVQAEGRTIEEVSFEISERLAVYIPSPEVSVSLQQGEGNRVYVTGRVNKPGVFLVNRPITVMQALSLAGGLTPFAEKKNILILRRDGTNQRSLRFNYKEVQRGESLQQNVTLNAGDTLVVP